MGFGKGGWGDTCIGVLEFTVKFVFLEGVLIKVARSNLEPLALL
jgi:hypothetical protein